MIKLLTIIGARPQIIKAAALSREILRFAQDDKGGAQDDKRDAQDDKRDAQDDKRGAQNDNCHPEEQKATKDLKIQETLLHTGQHYDANMSEVFFRELGIPAPDYNLGVGSGSHGEQTAKMLQGIEQVLLKDHFDGVVLYGDTNSTLAGAVAASKLHVPVFHIEAGLRSFNRSMPEEGNRIVADHLGDLLFAPTRTAVDNLEREGLAARTIQSGDVMYDNALHFAPLAEAKCDILQRLQLQPKEFVLATIHRPVNTDTPERLSAILDALCEIAQTTKVVLPLHPRTRNLLGPAIEKLQDKLILLPPASFFEIILLEKNARVVLTDSGGVQKEAFFYGTPSVILRQETEWVEIVDHGAGILADADKQRILEAYQTLKDRQVNFPPLFGDGHAAERIVTSIMQVL